MFCAEFRMGLRQDLDAVATRRAFQLSQPLRWRRNSGWPTISSTVRKPSLAMIRAAARPRTSGSSPRIPGLPLKHWRSALFCVATPTGHVSCWQSRCIRQPSEMTTQVAKPYSSAPSSAGDGHIAAGHQLAVGLERARGERRPLLQQRLLRLGQAQLPRQTGMVDGAARGGAGAAVAAGNENRRARRPWQRRRQWCRRRPRRPA